MNGIAGRSLFVLVCCLREAGLAQAVIAFEDLSALRLRADGGEFVAPVRFVESSVRNPESAPQVFYAGDKGLGLVTKEGKNYVPNLAVVAKEVLNYLIMHNDYGNREE